MDTQSIETSQLVGPALRYAVAVAAGFYVSRIYSSYLVTNWVAPGIGEELGVLESSTTKVFAPEEKWSQAGPLIDEHIEVLERHDGDDTGETWCSRAVDWLNRGDMWADGRGPLIAACRAIAASHWGEYADVPSELVQEKSDE